VQNLGQDPDPNLGASKWKVGSGSCHQYDADPQN
jgi:hypothetical protein